MTNVEDLTISLTVKETGKLGQLKKKLDSIMGAGSRGLDLDVDLPGFQQMKDDVRFTKNELKRQLSRIFPQFMPRSDDVKRVASMGAVLMKRIDEYKGNIKEYMEKTGYEKLADMFDMESANPKEIEEKLKEVLDSWKSTAQDIAEQNFGGKRALKWMEEVRSIVEKSGSDLEGIMTSFTKTLRHLPEEYFQKAMTSIAKTLGTYVEEEFQLQSLKPMEKLAEMFDTTKEDVQTILKDFGDLKLDEVDEEVVKRFKGEGVFPTTELFEAIQEISDDFRGEDLAILLKDTEKLRSKMNEFPELNELIRAYVRAGIEQREKIEFKFPEAIAELLRQELDVTPFRRGVDKLDNLLVNVSQDLANRFSALENFVGKVIDLEAKNVFEAKEHISQIDDRLKHLENVVILTGRLMPHARTSIEQMGERVERIVEPTKLMADLREMGLTKDFMEKFELDQLQKELSESIEQKEISSRILSMLRLLGDDPSQEILRNTVELLQKLPVEVERILEAIDALDIPKEQQQKMRSLF